MMLASDLFRLVFGLAAVVGMILAAAYAARKAGLSSLAGAGRLRRLAIREMLPLDARRRLAIIACDGREYLIVLGANGETLVDRDLAPMAPAADDAGSAISANPFAALAGLSGLHAPGRRPGAAGAPEKDAA